MLKDGLTGKVAFDDHGDRINAEYDIINVQEVNESGIVHKKEVAVGQFVFNKVSQGFSVSVFNYKGHKYHRYF